jgi:hypothetical protein
MHVIFQAVVLILSIATITIDAVMATRPDKTVRITARAWCVATFGSWILLIGAGIFHGQIGPWHAAFVGALLASQGRWLTRVGELVVMTRHQHLKTMALNIVLVIMLILAGLFDPLWRACT